MPDDEKGRGQLRARMIHAGLYGRRARAVLLGVKMVLIVAPAFFGLALGIAGPVPTQVAVLSGPASGSTA